MTTTTSTIPVRLEYNIPDPKGLRLITDLKPAERLKLDQALLSRQMVAANGKPRCLVLIEPESAMADNSNWAADFAPNFSWVCFPVFALATVPTEAMQDILIGTCRQSSSVFQQGIFTGTVTATLAE